MEPFPSMIEPSPNPGNQQANAADDVRIGRRAESELLDDGPELDFVALVDYIDGELDAEAGQRIQTYIRTWRRWHDEFWQTIDSLKDEQDRPL